MSARAGERLDATFVAVDRDAAVAPVNVAGFEVFGLGVSGLVLHEAVLGDTGWRVSDSVTGAAVTRTWPTRVEALASLDRLAGVLGDGFGAQVEGRRKAILAARG
jgi:hypothetical protein